MYYKIEGQGGRYCTVSNCKNKAVYADETEGHAGFATDAYCGIGDHLPKELKEKEENEV